MRTLKKWFDFICTFFHREVVAAAPEPEFLLPETRDRYLALMEELPVRKRAHNKERLERVASEIEQRSRRLAAVEAELASFQQQTEHLDEHAKELFVRRCINPLKRNIRDQLVDWPPTLNLEYAQDDAEAEYAHLLSHLPRYAEKESREEEGRAIRDGGVIVHESYGIVRFYQGRYFLCSRDGGWVTDSPGQMSTEMLQDIVNHRAMSGGIERRAEISS